MRDCKKFDRRIVPKPLHGAKQDDIIIPICGEAHPGKKETYESQRSNEYDHALRLL
jgi:hypothetical protein